MSLGKMTLHRFNGDEVFGVASATIEHYAAQNGTFCVTFRADARETPLQTLPDTEELKARPWVEWTLWLTEAADVALQVGSRFAIREGHSAERGYVTNLYYCEHEPMDDNEIEVMQRDGRRVRARITGMVTDVNYYDGSKPRTKVVVEADYELRDMQE